MWSAAATPDALHERRRGLASSHLCFPHPIRHCGRHLPRFAEKGKLRRLIAALAFVATALLARGAEAADRLRIAIQKTGTASWEIAVIKARGLDKAADLDIETTELASTEAGKVALEGGAADMVVGDWLWVARERGLGDKLLFTPYSSALGAVMTPKDSPVHSLADLAGRSIGVAGGPVDKSWLLLRAAALGAGLDLTKDARPSYGAPPLDRGETCPGRDRDRARILEFLRRSRGARLPPRDRDGRRREGARRERAGGDDRLCVQRILRGLAQGRAQAFFRGGGRGAQDPGAGPERLGADQGAAQPERRPGARSLSPALSRRRPETRPSPRRPRTRASFIAGSRRSAARSSSARPKNSTPVSSTIPRLANKA